MKAESKEFVVLARKRLNRGWIEKEQSQPPRDGQTENGEVSP